MITIYHNPRCGKSRETLALLEASDQTIQVVEYLKMPPSKGDLKSILEMLGMKPVDLIRKGEKLYKEDFKGKNFSDDEWLEIMVENPILIERPIVVNDDKAVIGRPPENVQNIL